MTLSAQDYIAKLSNDPQSLTFEDTLQMIDAQYSFVPTAFKNGNEVNDAGTNSGSCKVFSFAKLHKLSAQQALDMFAQHYKNVLDNPALDNHANIRAFMQTGFEGLSFDSDALSKL